MTRRSEPIAPHSPVAAEPRTPLSFDLAGVTLSFVCGDPQWQQWTAQRFGAFRCSGTPDWHVDVKLTGPAPAFLGSPRDVYPEPVEVGASDRGVLLSGATIRARLDPGRRYVELEGPLATYPTDCLLRHLLPLAIEDGLVLHAAMLATSERAWVCAGASGAGKSTLAGLLPELARCDELVAVRLVDGRWQARALPFWLGRPAHAPLEAVMLLRQAATHARRPLPAGVALRELATHVLWPVASPAAMDRSFDLLAKLVEAVPVDELGFAPTSDVGEVITAPGPR